MNSFNEARRSWYVEAVNYLSQAELNNVVIMFVGTKSDLSAKRHVDFRTVKDFCQSECLPLPIECSSLNCKNVDRVFQALGAEMLKKGVKRNRFTTKVKPVASSGSKCC